MTIFYSDVYDLHDESFVTMDRDKPSIVVLGVTTALNTYRACVHDIVQYDADLECVLPSILTIVSNRKNYHLELSLFQHECLADAGEAAIAEAMVFTSAYLYLAKCIASILEKQCLYSGDHLFYSAHSLVNNDIVLTTMQIPKIHVDNLRTTVANILINRTIKNSSL